MIRLNHKTQRFRMVHNGKTVARVDEVELGGSKRSRMILGYTYTTEGKRILDAQIPVEFKK